MAQLTDHKKVKKKEDQRMDASVLLGRGDKIILVLGKKKGGVGEERIRYWS